MEKKKVCFLDKRRGRFFFLFGFLFLTILVFSIFNTGKFVSSIKNDSNFSFEKPIYVEPSEIFVYSVPIYNSSNPFLSKSYKIKLTGNEKNFNIDSELLPNGNILIKVSSPDLKDFSKEGNYLIEKPSSFNSRKEKIKSKFKNENISSKEIYIYEKLPLEIGKEKQNLNQKFESNKYYYEFEINPSKETYFKFGENSGEGTLEEDLISYYKLDETTGDVIDSHGTNNGINEGATRGATGIINNSYDFDGSNDYVNIGDYIGGSEKISISVWVYPHSTSGENSIIGYYDYCGNDRSLDYGIGNGNARIRLYSHGFYPEIEEVIDIGTLFSTSTIPLNEWTNLVLTFDKDGEGKLYVNGSLEDTIDGNGLALHNSGNNAYIGKMNPSCPVLAYFDGKIDEVGIWSRELTSTEVEDLYNDGEGISYPLEVEIPELVKNISHLEHLYNMRYYLNETFNLTRNLDFNNESHYLNSSNKNLWTSGAGWLPIGNNSKRFNGELNGQGFTISNLFINNSSLSFAGLFGACESETIIDKLGLLNVNITAYINVGAIIGYSLAVVNNSYATGNIYGENQIGGLVGWQVSEDFTAIVENSYSRVNIDGNQNISGLVGVNGHDIKNSYSTGNVKCNALCDGLTSSGGASSSVLNSFWDINSSNQSSSGAGTGKTTQEMKLLGTFSSWNIEYNETDLNDGYPYLAWELNKSSPIWLIPEEGIPLIETLELNEINYSSATLRGDLIYLGSYCEGEIYFNYSEDNETWNSTEKETISEEEIYTKEITSLIIDFEYFYKICIDFESETLCGETLTFETSTPFLLNIPTNLFNTFIGTNTFTSNWNSVTNADGYRVQLSGNSAFENILFDGIVNSTFKKFKFLTDNSTYYWRVRAISESEYSNSSWTSLSIKTLDEDLTEIPPLFEKNIENITLDLNSNALRNLEEYFSGYDYFKIIIGRGNSSIYSEGEEGNILDSTGVIEQANIFLNENSLFSLNSLGLEFNTTAIVYAFNDYGNTSSNNFTIIVQEGLVDILEEEEEEGFIKKGISGILNFFPNSENLSFAQKLGFVFLTLIIINTLIFGIAYSQMEGIATSVMIFSLIVNLLGIIFFTSIGYLNYGVLIFLFLLGIGIFYLKIKINPKVQE
jgi:hypothetical protein